MYQFIIILQVLFGLGIIGLVLIQQGKGADAGAAFGSGASGSVFGAQGSASFLSRATAILAVFFFSTSLGLAVLIGHRDEAKDLMDIPEVEQGMNDVPLVSGSDEPMKVPSISQQMAQEEVPVAIEEVGTIEEIPVTIDNEESNDVPAVIVEEQPTTN